MSECFFNELARKLYSYYSEFFEDWEFMKQYEDCIDRDIAMVEALLVANFHPHLFEMKDENGKPCAIKKDNRIQLYNRWKKAYTNLPEHIKT